MITLPLVDVHRITADVPLSRLWASLLHTVAVTFGGAAPSCYALAVGCEPAGTTGAFPSPGSTLPGFRVAAHRPEAVLDLGGRHLFSRYRLRFEGSVTEGGAAELRASSFAEFPGRHGSAYRAAVVSTCLHALAMGRLMRTVRRDATSGGDRTRNAGRSSRET